MVLIRNIAYEAKREPLKLTRIEEIKKSRDDAQRVVVVTYHNIGINKKGEWIGTPVTVERSVNDLVLVDDALDESMLNPEVENMDMRTNIDDQASGNNEDIGSENQETQRIFVNNEKTENKDDQLKKEIIMDDPGDNITIEKRKIENEPNIEVRRSQRKRNQRIDIQPKQIGGCDDAKDVDYK